MPKRISTFTTADFQGGLNLNADPFQLGKNETSDCLNVDFDPLGGFHQRDAINSYAPTWFSGTFPSLWQFATPNGEYSQVMYQAYFSPGVMGGTSAIPMDAAPSTVVGDVLNGRMYATTFRDPQNLSTACCYIQRNAEHVPIRWNGTVGHRLVDPSPSGWNENFAAPAHNKMPKAKFITTHRNYVFVANTVENGTSYTSRIRWSHPGFPEDWRADDWIDIEPGAGDAITAIASWQDRLLIFKNNAVFMLLGYDADSFEVVNVSRTIGALNQGAVAVAEEGVFFFSWPEGVFFFNGSKLRDLFTNLRPMITDGTVAREERQYISCSWVKQRLWVSIPTVDDEWGHGHTLVWDPALGRGGGWTKYAVGSQGSFWVGFAMESCPPGQDSYWYGIAGWNLMQIAQLHITDQAYDYYSNYDVPATYQRPIRTRYQTPWIDLGNPALVKSWRRPVLVLTNEDNYTLNFTTYGDYNTTEPLGTFTKTVASGAASWLFWDIDNWDERNWATVSGVPQQIAKGARLGRATAVSLLVEGPSTAADAAAWGVNAITWKYIPKRIRS